MSCALSTTETANILSNPLGFTHSSVNRLTPSNHRLTLENE